MPKILRCQDVFPGCTAEVRANTDDEILRQAAEHAQRVHGVETVDDTTVEKVRAAIRPA
jgi:predicted small metal-binding protein